MTGLFEIVGFAFSDQRKLFDFAAAASWSRVFGFSIVMFCWYAVVLLPLFLMGRGSVSIDIFLSALLAGLAVVFVAWLVWIFIWSGFVHVSVRLWGGSAGFGATARIILFSLAPLFVVGSALVYLQFIDKWLLILVFLLYIFCTWLMVRGIACLHKISVLSALFAYLLPLALLFWMLAFLVNSGVIVWPL